MARYIAVTAAWLGLVASVVAQSDSHIGQFLAPWGGYTSGPIAMTPEGEQILFVEASAWCNFGDEERLSVIRSDGTGYRVVLDVAELQALMPFANKQHRIERLIVSGDGRRAAFWWAGLYEQASCASSGSPRWFLLDLEHETVVAFQHDGKDVGHLSLTDDASRMVFEGWDATLRQWWWFVADGDGGNAVPFLDPSGWLTTFGKVSGDGSRFLMVGYHGGFPFPSDVYMYEFATSELIKLSPSSHNDLKSADLSFDGSRVVYAENAGQMFGVLGTSAGYHRILIPTPAGGTATISRNGAWVYFGNNAGPDGQCYRVSWAGADLAWVSDLWTHVWSLNHLPISSDGSFLAHWSIPVVAPQSLTVTTLSPPMLTTYGYGTAGTPLTWDILGHAGDTFVLAWALGPASLPLGSYGTLALEPASLQILCAGAIEGSDNAASLTIMLPPAVASLPEPVPVHFQALVLGPAGGKLTNATVVPVGATSAGALAATGGPWTAGARTTRPAIGAGRGLGWWKPARAETPEERWEQLVRTDPALWEAVHGELPRR